MTAAERLLQLAGTTGTAAALLLAIGVGATTGEALNKYSVITEGTAAEHLLSEGANTWDTSQGIARNKNTLVKFEKISDVEHRCAPQGAASGVKQPDAWASAAAKPYQEGANSGVRQVYPTSTANAFIDLAGEGAVSGCRVLAPWGDSSFACLGVGSVSGAAHPVCGGDAVTRRARSLQGIGGGRPITFAKGIQNPTDEQLSTIAYLLTSKQAVRVRI